MASRCGFEVYGVCVQNVLRSETAHLPQFTRESTHFPSLQEAVIPPPIDLAFICVIILVATTVRSTLGFGEALIAMPLLAFIVPLRVAAPLVAMISMTNAILILCREWRHLRIRESARLVVSALIGTPVGVWLLTTADESVVKCLLASVVLAFSGWSLWRPDLLSLKNDRFAPLFGFAGGVLGGAYNTAGPPLVMFGTLRRWPPQEFRANLQSFFLLGGISILSMHWFTGAITVNVAKLYGMSLPLVFTAALIGRRLTQTVPAARFTRFVHVGLLGIGTMLLVTVFAK